MKLQFKVQPIPEYNQTRIHSKFAWLPTKIQTNSETYHYIWLESYKEEQRWDGDRWRTCTTRFDDGYTKVRYLNNDQIDQ